MNFILLFLLVTLSTAAKSLQIYAFNVGHADSQLVVFPSGYSILIDVGEPAGTTGEAGRNGKYLSNRLYKILGKKRIDILVLTHFHTDHVGGYKIGGIWYLIEKAGFTFGKFIRRNTGTYKGSKFADCNKNTITWANVGKTTVAMSKFICYATSSVEKTKLSKIAILAKECSTSQIHPPDANAQVKIIIRDAKGVKETDGRNVARTSTNEKNPVEENDFSICLRISFEKFVYATCGDLNGQTSFPTKAGSTKIHNIESLVAPFIGEVDLLHLNHHGLATSSNAVWCNTLKPTVAYASCGVSRNVIPAKQVLTNLKNVNAKIYTTGKCYNGTISGYESVVQMQDDIVVTVPTGATSFTVANSKGGKKKSFKIKTSKKAPKTCVQLNAVAK